MSKANWREVPCGMPYVRAYKWGDLLVIVGDEPPGWHISISNPYRYPTWEEIKQARYDLVPHDVSMAMLLPPPDEYVNIHENCFHLHEIPPDGEWMPKRKKNRIILAEAGGPAKGEKP